MKLILILLNSYFIISSNSVYANRQEIKYYQGIVTISSTDAKTVYDKVNSIVKRDISSKEKK